MIYKENTVVKTAKSADYLGNAGQDYLTEMKMRTGFEPDKEVLVAEAVRSSSYGYFESQVVQHVVLGDRSVDLVNGVCEFTDWNALGSEVDGFLSA